MNKVIVAPLNWGLGHATRCIPIIKSLLENNYVPVIASDGVALTLLQKEFPSLEFIQLPSYNIRYSKNLKWKLLFHIPKILGAVRKEGEIIRRYIDKNNVVGIISDNRFGVRNTTIPSVYITHQINVLTGFFTGISSKIHQKIIKNFDECWIPDRIEKPTFSGKLSELKNNKIKTKHIGILSRFEKEDLQVKNDLLIILSGPEPHRTTLELKILKELEGYQGKAVLVQGCINEKQTRNYIGPFTVYNYLLAKELQDEINSSQLVVCRSGYSSIMDLAKLNKKAFFIPTPNQSEQEYLARYLEAQNIAPFDNEEVFNMASLEKVKEYQGLQLEQTTFNASLFDLFKGK